MSRWWLGQAYRAPGSQRLWWSGDAGLTWHPVTGLPQDSSDPQVTIRSDGQTLSMRSAAGIETTCKLVPPAGGQP